MEQRAGAALAVVACGINGLAAIRCARSHSYHATSKGPRVAACICAIMPHQHPRLFTNNTQLRPTLHFPSTSQWDTNTCPDPAPLTEHVHLHAAVLLRHGRRLDGIVNALPHPANACGGSNSGGRPHFTGWLLGAHKACALARCAVISRGGSRRGTKQVPLARQSRSTGMAALATHRSRCAALTQDLRQMGQHMLS